MFAQALCQWTGPWRGRRGPCSSELQPNDMVTFPATSVSSHPAAFLRASDAVGGYQLWLAELRQAPTDELAERAAAFFTSDVLTLRLLLGVSDKECEDAAVLKRKFRAVSLVIHPDVRDACTRIMPRSSLNASSQKTGVVHEAAKKVLTDVFVRVTMAHQVLSDPRKRAEYEQGRSRGDASVDHTRDHAAKAGRFAFHLERVGASSFVITMVRRNADFLFPARFVFANACRAGRRGGCGGRARTAGAHQHNGGAPRRV